MRSPSSKTAAHSYLIANHTQDATDIYSRHLCHRCRRERAQSTSAMFRCSSRNTNCDCPDTGCRLPSLWSRPYSERRWRSRFVTRYGRFFDYMWRPSAPPSSSCLLTTRKSSLRYHTMRDDIFTCAQQLSKSQLNPAHCTKKMKNRKKLKTDQLLGRNGSGNSPWRQSEGNKWVLRGGIFKTCRFAWSDRVRVLWMKRVASQKIKKLHKNRWGRNRETDMMLMKRHDVISRDNI